MKMPAPATFAIIGAFALACGCTTDSVRVAHEPEPVVYMPDGAVRGLRDGDASIYRAIPYALPPTGNRRWRPPAPMPRWSGVRLSQQPGAACVQPPMAEGPYQRGPQVMDED